MKAAASGKRVKDSRSAMVNAVQNPALALYIHWPFCVSKCPYCDFNSHVRDAIDIEAWRAALLTDIKHEAGLISGSPLTSIFFGGGTPSLMPPSLVAELIEAAQERWGFSTNIEITLEANPNSVEVARFADLAAAGVNRVSLGVQSFEPEALRFLGRAHDADEARRAIDMAQAHFQRTSFDLIYALPNQSVEDWSRQLHLALALGSGHMSLYQLTIEPGTRFETMVRRGEFMPADPDHAADLYETTQGLMTAAGLPAYEISNHARPGEESRHNLTYWRYQDYVGIGPGAHGRRHGVATQRHRKPENWLAAVKRNGHGLQEETPLAATERANEALMMGLRLSEGVDLADLASRFDLSISEMIDEKATRGIVGMGLLDQEADHIAVTATGMLLLDAILPQVVR
jgi:oxygen-independent coproporphyrinogen-3 oxidase